MADFDHISLTLADTDVPRDIPPPRGSKQKTVPPDRLVHAQSLRQQVRDLVGGDGVMGESVPLVLELQPGYSSRAKSLRGVLEGLGLEFGRVDDNQHLTVWTTKDTAERFEERLERFARSKRREGPTFNPIKGLRRTAEESLTAALRERLASEGGEAPTPVLIELDSSAPADTTLRFVDAVRRSDPQARFYEGKGVHLTEARLTSRQIAFLTTSHPAINKVDVQTDYAPVLTGEESEPAPAGRLLTLAPGASSPVVCIVDTGVDCDHPYLQGIIEEADHADYVADAADEMGHGTFVAGIVAYADTLQQQIDSGVLRPGCRVISVKAFGNERPGTDQILHAVSDALRKYRPQTAVFNLSLQGDASYLLHTRHRNVPTPLATELDRLAREHDVLFIVAAGNVSPRLLEHVDVPFPLSHRSPRFAIRSPAEGINVLSVGACNGAGDHAALLGEPGSPSSCSTLGPGVAGMRKPEVVSQGGGYIDDGHSILAAPETSVFSLRPMSRGGTGYGVGTSYAAALVARLAAALQHRYPYATANLLKALIIHSAETVGPTFSSPDAEDIWRCLSGFGRPRDALAVASDASRVWYLFQGTLKAGKRQDIRFFVPASFRHSPKPFVRSTLVYDPPVYPGSSDYYSKLQVTFSLRAPRSGRLQSVPAQAHDADDAHNVKQRCYTVPGWCRAGVPWMVRVTCQPHAGIPLDEGERDQRFALVIELQDLTGQFPLYRDCRAHYLQQAA